MHVYIYKSEKERTYHLVIPYDHPFPYIHIVDLNHYPRDFIYLWRSHLASPENNGMAIKTYLHLDTQ